MLISTKQVKKRVNNNKVIEMFELKNETHVHIFLTISLSQ